jgi:hypothetical protein
MNRSSKSKHLFSTLHAQDIYNALLKRIEPFSLWIQSVEGGKKPSIIPSVYFTKSTRGYKICYACKTLEETSELFSACSCGRVADNAAIIKDILATKTFIANPLYQKSLAVETKTADTQTEGGGDTQKLQKEVARLKKQIEIDEQTVEEAEDMADGLFSVLELIQDDSLNMLIAAMKHLKKNHPLAYERQKRFFGSTWDESLMSQAE